MVGVHGFWATLLLEWNQSNEFIENIREFSERSFNHRDSDFSSDNTEKGKQKIIFSSILYQKRFGNSYGS